INLDLKIQLISSDSKVKKGDVIITSGLGGVYPKGIYVGKVVETKVRPNSLFKDVKIESKVDFLKVELVLVITNPAKVPQFSSGEESVLK
ncbi:MAG: rod shape-determining protein MreC, partial [Candidatus Subteraquimicrobiales bacterium]|nr:rod shape-determining protein MreC [Candidatus Subteraquimicrobiales bacterium]